MKQSFKKFPDYSNYLNSNAKMKLNDFPVKISSTTVSLSIGNLLEEI